MQSLELHAQHLDNAGAPTLVITHGLLGSSTNWRGLGRALTRQYDVWLLDLRNHGQSPHSEAHDYPLMAADIAAFLEREALDDVTLLGHSMGGKAAMWLALHDAARVARLVVADIAPQPSPGDHRDILDALLELDLRAVTSRGDADSGLSERIADAGIRAWLLQNLVTDARGARWRVNLDALSAAHETLIDWPVPDTGATYPGPTLFLRGARSDYLPADALPALHALFPAAELETIDDAGHWLHAEQPRAFLEAVTRFAAST